jgi:hypothetical protein
MCFACHLTLFKRQRRVRCLNSPLPLEEHVFRVPPDAQLFKRQRRVRCLNSPLPLKEHVFRVPPDALQEAEERQARGSGKAAVKQ